jgi:hypothetical protein
MNIRISIYDFFAYTIPGGVYLFIGLYVLSQFGILNFDFLSFNPSFFQLVIIAGSAYILGMLMEPIAKVWYGLFKPKDFPEKVLKGFQENRPHIEVKFKATDWPILMASTVVFWNHKVKPIAIWVSCLENKESKTIFTS